MIFITSLFNVTLNLQLTKMILGLNILSIFILFILIYANFTLNVLCKSTEMLFIVFF